MDNRYIIVLETGSSKIKGLAAAVGELGDIDIIATEEVRVTDCVRYGKIQNVQEVSSNVNAIIRKLENHPRISPRKVTDVFVALGGRTLSTVTAQAHAGFPGAVEISADTITRLKRDASFGLVTDKDNLDMIPHAYFVDNTEVKNVVGTVGTNIRAEFTAVVISPVIKRNLDLIKLENHNLTRHYVVRATALADLVLTPSERQIGCALVDFGAETTTVSIYKDDTLQSITTLPLGSRNITRDLMTGLSMTEDRAEAAKARAGVVLPADTDPSTDIEINNYISARAGEIAANILHIIDASGFKPQTLAGGIILAGGGSKLKGFNRVLEAQAKIPVRHAAVDSSLQFKGNTTDLSSNLDVLAIAKYAAEHSATDCLSPLPETHANNSTDDYDNTADSYNESDAHSQQGGARRRNVDDDSLLQDDDDDIPTSEFPAIRAKSRKTRTAVRNNVPQAELDLDDDTLSTDDGRRSMIGKIKDRIARMWDDPHEDSDDLDEPAD